MMAGLILKDKRRANEHNSLGASFFNSGAVELAVKQFEIAVTLAPDDAAYWRNLGAALLEMGLIEDADRALRRSIELDPNSGHSHFHLGQLLTNAASIGQRFVNSSW
jgi:Flp pilus assembly protein TadD